MVELVKGDIVQGGQRGYYQVIHADGTHSAMVQVLDNLGEPTQTYVMGATVRGTTGDVYTVSTPNPLQPNTPHDVDWVTDDSGLLIAMVPSAGVLKFRLYDFAEPPNLIHEWTPAIETGWQQQPVKISVACDKRTVYYTSSLFKIKRYDIGASGGTGAQLTDYKTLPASSPFRYGGLRVLPGENGDERDVVVATTRTGNGPSRALALADDRKSFWTDEINPPGQYHIIKWRLSDRTQLQTVVIRADDATPTPANDKTLSLASYYNPCAGFGGNWISRHV